MSYGTSHLLIGGGYFQGEGQEKILLCKGRGHYIKKKNIGRCALSIQPDHQKRPKCKNAQKMQKKISNIEKIFLARFAHSAFYKIHISGASNRHSQFNMQNMLLFFFLSSHHDTSPLLHLYHFRKKI